MRWRFVAVLLAGILTADIVREEWAAGFGLQSMIAVVLSALLLWLLVRTPR